MGGGKGDAEYSTSFREFERFREFVWNRTTISIRRPPLPMCQHDDDPRADGGGFSSSPHVCVAQQRSRFSSGRRAAPSIGSAARGVVATPGESRASFALARRADRSGVRARVPRARSSAGFRRRPRVGMGRERETARRRDARRARGLAPASAWTRCVADASALERVAASASASTSATTTASSASRSLAPRFSAAHAPAELRLHGGRLGADHRARPPGPPPRPGATRGGPRPRPRPRPRPPPPRSR